MAGIKGQPSAKPQDLKAPVPNQIDFSELEGLGADQPDFSELDALGAVSSPAIEGFGEEVPVEEVIPPEEAMSPLPAPTGLASAGEQLREAGARFRNAFAVTPAESVEVLKQSGMFEDVRQGADGVEVRRPGRKGWEKFDRDKVELIGDTLDWARDIMEMGVEGGVEVLGTLAGAIPTAGTGTVPANMAAGATGAVVAKNAGDVVAEQLLGIKKDPKRSAAMENTVAASFGAGFGWLGSKMARAAATRRALKVEGDKSIQAVVKQVDEAAEDIAEVKRSGITLNADGEFKLDPNMATGGADPEARATAKWLSDTPGYRNFERQVGDNLKSAYASVAERLGSDIGKRAELGKDFVLSSKDVRKAEGKLIGSFRDLADKKLAGKPQPAPRSLQTIQMMKQELADSQGKLSVESIIDRNPSLSEAQAKTLIARINRMETQLTKGRMTVDSTRMLYDDLTKIIDNTQHSLYAKPYGQALLDMKNAVRDDWIDMIDSVLPPNQQEAYRGSLKRYREIMGATDSLGRLLENENISKDVLSKKLFEGSNSYEFMQSAKTLIKETNPALWDNLTNEYFQRQMRSAMTETIVKGADGADRTVRNFDWNKVARNWNGLDPRVRNELSLGIGVSEKGMNALLNLGQRYQNSTVEQLAKEPAASAARGLVKNAISLVWGGGAAKGTATVGMLENMGKDQALMKWLQSNGNMEQILREMKGLKPSRRTELMTFVNEWTPRAVVPVVRTESRRSVEDKKK